MGRYYNCDSGRSGKFMFAVQNSDDPEFLGMSEDTSTIHYYASEDDVDKITERLNEQYDILTVPKEDRIYVYPKGEDGNDDIAAYDEWEKRVLYSKVWRDVKTSDLDEEEKEKEKEGGEKNKNDIAMRWSSEKGDNYVAIERPGGTTLALARIRLALTILSDIKDEGYCSLEAET